MIPGSIWEGEVQCTTQEEADHAWCAVVARGRIVERTADNCRDRHYQLHLVLVEHPELPAGEVYALFFMGFSTPKVYRTTRADALEALHDPSAFNLA